jgi:prophage maintenance system killer protein
MRPSTPYQQERRPAFSSSPHRSSHGTMAHVAIRHIGLSVGPRFRSSGSAPCLSRTRGLSVSPHAAGVRLGRFLGLVKNREFKLDKPTFCSLHALVARNETLEWGHFRGEGPETQFTPYVALGERGRFAPLATEPGAVRLNEVFENGIHSLQREVSNPFERATAFFLFGSLQQFFFDGNKRTSRFMMNGVLMTAGIDAVSIPAVRAAQFNSRMVDFYMSRNATEMMSKRSLSRPGKPKRASRLGAEASSGY